MILLLLACPKGAEPAPAAAPPPSGPHVQVATGLDPTLALPEELAMRAVLDAAAPAARVCYEQALARNARTYGDLEIAVTLAADGAPRSVGLIMSTTGDADLDACVVGVAGTLRFPPPSKDGLTLRYPFVFTSDLTPPEVTRALLLRHGLIELEDEQEQLELEAAGEIEPPAERGWVPSW